MKKNVIYLWQGMRRPLCAFIFLVFSYVSLYCLLTNGMIGSSEFVTLVIAGTCTSLVLFFAPLLSEIAIGGNVIKLREVKSQAEKSIAEFDSARVSLLVAVISALKNSTPSFNDSLSRTDNRASLFLDLYESNKDLATNDLFRREALSAAKIFEIEALNQIQVDGSFSGEDINKAVMPDAVDSLFREKYGTDRPLTLAFKQYRELYTLVKLLS